MPLDIAALPDYMHWNIDLDKPLMECIPKRHAEWNSDHCRAAAMQTVAIPTGVCYKKSEEIRTELFIIGTVISLCDKPDFNNYSFLVKFTCTSVVIDRTRKCSYVSFSN